MGQVIRPVRLAVSGMTSTELDAFYHWLHDACELRAVVVEEASAQALCLDMGKGMANEQIRNWQAKYPERPVLLLAEHDPGYPDVIFIKKPVQVTAFLDALDEITLAFELEHLPPGSNIYCAEDLAQFSDSGRRGDSRSSIELDDSCFEAFVGNSFRVTLQELEQQSPKIFFEPHRYLLPFVISAVKKAKEKNRVLHFKATGFSIYLFPAQKMVWYDLDEDSLRDYCTTAITDWKEFSAAGEKPFSVIFEERLSARRVDFEQEGFDREHLYSIDSFIWMLALWTSSGRLMKGLDPSLPFQLMQWPNFSRLVVSPHAMRIAVLLLKTPMTVVEVAQSLKIDLKYVLVFVSAANAIGIIAQRAAMTRETAKPVEQTSPSSSVFKRLTSRFKKG